MGKQFSRWWGRSWAEELGVFLKCLLTAPSIKAHWSCRHMAIQNRGGWTCLTYLETPWKTAQPEALLSLHGALRLLRRHPGKQAWETRKIAGQEKVILSTARIISLKRSTPLKTSNTYKGYLFCSRDVQPWVNLMVELQGILLGCFVIKSWKEGKYEINSEVHKTPAFPDEAYLFLIQSELFCLPVYRNVTVRDRSIHPSS